MDRLWSLSTRSLLLVLLLCSSAAAGKRLIFVHGLGNKPDKRTLTSAWGKACRIGLARIRSTAQLPSHEMAYWAAERYEHPNPRAERSEPQLGRAARRNAALSISRSARTRPWLERAQHAIVDTTVALDGRFDHRLLRGVLKRSYPDLHDYLFDSDKRAAIQRGLRQQLLEHRGDDVLVVGHSMGSLVAYDVLHDLSITDPDLRVDLVTIGSPLGHPAVARPTHARRKQRTTAPRAVASWTDISDPRDKHAVAITRAQRPPGARPGARPREAKTVNLAARPDGSLDPHHFSGYLASPEFAETLHRFIER